MISVAAIDPGNLEVDLQAGSALGYTLIWVLLLSSMLGWLLQTLAAHLTIYSGYHLAQLYALAYQHDPFLSASIFGMAELSIVAFDVAEVVGTAFALQMLFGCTLWFGMILSALDTILVLFLQRRGLTKVEIFIEGLLFILAVCLFYDFFLSRPAFSEMFKASIVPSLGDKPRQGAVLAIGLLGSVIMAHNIFLHSWLVHQRMHDDDSNSLYSEPCSEHLSATTRYATIEAAAIFGATFLINTCVLSISASIPHDLMPENLGLRNAGLLLQNVLRSDLASTAWAVALLASGHAATVTGALASQAVCEGFLNIRQDNSSSALVLGTRMIAIFPALIVGLIAGEQGSDGLVVVSQVALSLALPFAVIPMFKLLGYIGGRQRRNGGSAPNAVMVYAGYLAFGVLLVGNLYAVYSILHDMSDSSGQLATNGALVVGVLAGCLIYKLIRTPVYIEEYEMVQERALMREQEQLLIEKVG